MSQLFHIHSDNPQLRLIRQAAKIIRAGGVIACPTDSSYALACHLDDKKALDRVRQIRQLDNQHAMTLVCRDLSEIAIYAKVDNLNYRLLKAHTPGAYTFLLRATSVVPKRLMHPARRVIGIRVPDHPIMQALLEELGEPLMTTSLRLPEEEYPLLSAQDVCEKLAHCLDLVIEGGPVQLDATSVIDLTGDMPRIVREGLGKVTSFQSGQS